ncbi:AMP-binding protein (plasmid) [Rhodococcus sp. ZPP]|uniref:AMP-binding protein n=1 Tax=Rhodococcus sp. ZPP TaxID=2749906 RepID=UPI001AD8868D|nr:AMP-binding protein [Rhodococcus sp. ZPP]QTJ70556.1 AMP-binding protein [Rhodococcus sp. ZPP]
MSTTTERYRAARDLLRELSDDYAGAVNTFTWPEMGDQFNWAIDWFDAIARGNDTVALWIAEQDGSERKYTYDEMARRSDRVAAHLAAHGVKRGHRVLVMLNNQVELWDAMLAVMKLGAVLLPTTTALGASDLAARISRADIGYAVVNSTDVPKFGQADRDITLFVATGHVDSAANILSLRDAYTGQDVPATPHPGTAPSDPQLLYFTSGTTSSPKLVEHNQVSYSVGHLATSYWIGAQPGDVHLNVASPGWAKHAWSCFFAPWIAEATIFIYNYPRFDAAELLAQIRRVGVNTFCAPPTVWRMLIGAELSNDKGQLRELLSAGEPLNPEVIEHVRSKWGLSIRDGFGQTELPLAVGNLPGKPIKPGSMGLPLPGLPIVLVDPITGRPADEGEICVDLALRPMSLMTGYRDDAERNAAALSGGYYHTGDIARRDSDGYLFYIGRSDDVFKASDYKISPFELESVLIEHPAVAESAVVPAPDEVRLAVPKAYITLTPGHEPSRELALEILKFARENLAPYQRIRRLEFANLPKTISGKIRRVELRERETALAQRPTTEATEWRDDQFPELRS